jgi:energy-coupling factor transporter ATP-binding protein EcfA2
METTVAEHFAEIDLAYKPEAPDNLQELDLPLTMVEDLMLRYLYAKGASRISKVSDALKLSFPVIDAVFQQLRKRQLFEVTGMEGNDYAFSLSGTGQEYAFNRFNICHYAGPAPVSVKNYFAAVRAQVAKLHIDKSFLKKSLTDLVLTDGFLDQLGPALISQNSIFLYGPTGNGKTSVVRRLARIYRDAVLIPYAVEFDGQIIVMYDPAVHEKVDKSVSGIDPRWVLCRRPCILVGGELEPKMLELQLEESTQVYAAPLQMRANNGMLVIDDFGRQILSPQYLLNRWIVPLDRRVDYLTLRYGVKFQIPFEMIVVFSTNLDPNDLADEAFLRRIQNKIHMEAANSQVFDEIFNRLITEGNYPCEPNSAEFLRKLCLHLGPKELRACYPRDIIDILVAISGYEGLPMEVSKANLKRAVTLYFTKTMTDAKKQSQT